MSDLGLAVCCVVFLVFTWICFYFFGVSDQQKKAVEANVAYYKVDPKTGATELVYDCPNCGKETK